MHAVLIEVDVAGVGPEQGLKGLREQIVPAISALPGFQSGTWLTGGVDGKGLSLTLWDSEENAVPCRAVPCHATPRHATPRHATPRHATPRHATPRQQDDIGALLSRSDEHPALRGWLSAHQSEVCAAA